MYESFADLADAHLNVLSPHENVFEVEFQHRPTKRTKQVHFDLVRHNQS